MNRYLAKYERLLTPEEKIYGGYALIIAKAVIGKQFSFKVTFP
jgi:hypothetical protein